MEKKDELNRMTFSGMPNTILGYFDVPFKAGDELPVYCV